MQDYGTPAFKHAIHRGCFGVATRHEKVVFTPKKDKIDVWCNDTTTLHYDIARRFGLWAPEEQRVFGNYCGNHISRFINGAISIRQALLYCYKYTCHSCGNRFFHRPAQVAQQDCRHFGSGIVEQIWQNEVVSCR